MRSHCRSVVRRDRTLLATPVQALEPRRLLAAGQDDPYVAGHTYSYDATAEAVAVQKDGKVLVASSTYRSGVGYVVSVARFLPTGGLDTSFNDVASPSSTEGDGKKSFQFAAGKDAYAADIAVDSAGRIVVVGSSEDFNYYTHGGIARLNPNGTLDTSFDGDGTRILDVTGDTIFLETVAVQASGKIVVGGGSDGSFDDALLARLNVNGSLDTSFSNDGWLAFSWVGVIPSYADDWISDLYVEEITNRVTFVGVAENNDFGIGRVTGSGALDLGFDGDGLRRIDAGTPVETAAVANWFGVPVAVFATWNSATTDFVVRRFTGSGGNDTGYDGDGAFSYKHFTGGSGTGYYAAVADLVVQRDGKLVIGGTARDPASGSDSRPIVARLNAYGGFDVGFDGDGKRTLTFDGSPIYGYGKGIALDGDGKIYAIERGVFSDGIIRVYRLQGGQYGYRNSTGSSWPASQTVQGEDFDLGGLGESYHDVSPTYDSSYRGGYQDVAIVLGRRGMQVDPTEWGEYSFALPAGTYTLELTAVGTGNPATVAASVNGATLATFGNIGASGYSTLTRTVTISSANPVLRLTGTSGGASIDALRLIPAAGGGTINGVLWRDDDGDDFRDVPAEPLIVGRTVYLDANNNSTRDSSETSTTTNSSGTYAFSNVSPGTYKVRQVLPGGWEQTAPNNGWGHNAVVTAGATAGPYSFGSRPTGGGGTAGLSGIAWRDDDADDAKDAGEPFVSGRIVYLDFNNNVALDSGEPTRTTATNGSYAFTGLAAGTYKVRQILPAGWQQTKPDSGYGHNATVASGQTVGNLDFGSRPGAPPPLATTAPAAARGRSGLFSELELDRR